MSLIRICIKSHYEKCMRVDETESKFIKIVDTTSIPLVIYVSFCLQTIDHCVIHRGRHRTPDST